MTWDPKPSEKRPRDAQTLGTFRSAPRQGSAKQTLGVMAIAQQTQVFRLAGRGGDGRCGRARSLTDALAAIDRIQAAGGTFVSVQDGFDLSTDTGRLVLRLMLSMEEWELDRVRSNWRIAQERAIRRGVHVGCSPPVGYRRGGDGRLEIDPSTAPFIREAFQMRANRTSIRLISAHLEANGIRTGRGFSNWCYSTTAQMFKRRA